MTNNIRKLSRRWYQHLIGLNYVEGTRQKVILLQSKLAKCHELRHNVNQRAFITNNVEKLSNLIKGHKYNLLNNLNEMISNINKRHQQVKENIEKSSTLEQLRTVPLELQKPIPKKVVHWWGWYQHLIGLNSVEEARQKVILLQSKLAKCHEVRHNINQRAFMTNNRMKEIYDELLRLRRDDPKYVTLTIEENKNLQEQKVINERLQLLEKEEKDCFLHFTIAINEYQAAQALNAQKFKYISLLASAFVGLLSLIMSLIYNDRRTKEMSHILSELNERNKASMENYLNSLTSSILSTQKETIAKPPAEPPAEPPVESGWSDILKKSAYVVSIFLMMKGIVF